jgi:hypothetical protein
VVLAAGFDDAARARWVRRLLGEIATREPGARCTLVRAVPDTLRFASQKAPAPMSLPPATQPTQPAQSTPPAQLTQSTQLAQPAQFTPPTSLTLIERRPPCLCCSDAGLADELARLASPLASPLDAPLASAAPRPVCACACAWLIVELPAATLVWTREELLRTLPSPAPRLSTVMVRRPSAANNAAGAALWNLPGLADFDVHDGDSATTAVRAIIQNAARAGDQFLHKNEDQQTRLSYINECKIEGT